MIRDRTLRDHIVNFRETGKDMNKGKVHRISAPSNVLALLCAMYFINYIVRVNVSTAAAVFQPELHLSNTQVGLIFSMFAFPYLVFQFIGGWVSDRWGARKALTAFAVIWSAAIVIAPEWSTELYTRTVKRSLQTIATSLPRRSARS